MVLGAAAVVALLLTRGRDWAEENQADLRAVVQMAAVTTLIQTVHFTEELSTGLDERLPALLGLPPIPLGGFVVFNVAWIVIWGLSVLGLARRVRVSLFPLWFLGIASAANGVAHPLLALLAGQYFPGLVTSPVAGVMGVLLFRRLLRITRRLDAMAVPA